jgi:hypothetical protein
VAEGYQLGEKIAGQCFISYLLFTALQVHCQKYCGIGKLVLWIPVVLNGGIYILNTTNYFYLLKPINISSVRHTVSNIQGYKLKIISHQG